MFVRWLHSVIFLSGKLDDRALSPRAGRAPNPYPRSATVNAPQFGGRRERLPVRGFSGTIKARKYFRQRGPRELVSECRAGGCRSGAVSEAGRRSNVGQ